MSGKTALDIMACDGLSSRKIFARASEIAIQRFPSGTSSATALGGIVREAITELLRDSDGSGEAVETAKTGSTRRATARAEGIAKTTSGDTP